MKLRLSMATTVGLMLLLAASVPILQTQGIHPSRTLSGIAVLLVLMAGAASLLVWAERRTERRFAHLEAQLRATRPDHVAGPYVGAEGRGVAFDGPGGRIVLLWPPGHVGEPRIMHLAGSGLSGDALEVHSERPTDGQP